jgi:hypothetical protein
MTDGMQYVTNPLLVLLLLRMVKAPGDAQGFSTFVRADGVSSFIDYCLVDAALVSALTELTVAPKVWEWDDHHSMVAM